MSRQERAMDYRRRMLHDLDVVLMENGVSPLTLGEDQYDNMIQDLADCGMHHIEFLLLEATS